MIASCLQVREVSTIQSRQHCGYPMLAQDVPCCINSYGNAHHERRTVRTHLKPSWVLGYKNGRLHRTKHMSVCATCVMGHYCQLPSVEMVAVVCGPHIVFEASTT